MEDKKENPEMEWQELCQEYKRLRGVFEDFFPLILEKLKQEKGFSQEQFREFQESLDAVHEAENLVYKYAHSHARC